MNINIREIRIATRESKLALWQAEHVAGLLRAHYPQLQTRLVPMTTRGDQLLNTPLSRIGGKGLFIKELEQALLNGDADIAVHSMKDVGIHLPEGFVLAAILPRENPFDAFVSNRYSQLADLPHNAIVGTCSLRRRMQLARYRPDLQLRDLRGNVQTRLNKLDQNDFDAIILACAGLIRLDLQARMRETIPKTISLPAIGQGAIGIECRNGSPALALVSVLNDDDTALCVQTERIINTHLEGSCQVPIAAFATLQQENIHLEARIGMPDGSHYISANDKDRRQNAAALGHEIAARLINNGARDILDALAHA
ncbi:MAG: hydroxymethylbilane synthase [Cardiobacteriaceae bacterium]|nr:hydroxymethylbilane synthase [Cardiobacteriaceae bacterium]